jgi:hypothetical protein
MRRAHLQKCLTSTLGAGCDSLLSVDAMHVDEGHVDDIPVITWRSNRSRSMVTF